MSNILTLVQLLLSSFSLLSSLSSSSSITLVLVRQRLNHQHSKHVKTGKMPLYPRNYGEYSLYLDVGTPPQTLLFSMDTGSSQTWFPCTKNYTCNRCNSTYVNAAHIPTCNPKSSSSYKPLTCESPKCNSLLMAGGLHCKNKTKIELCGYNIGYGSGSTYGQLVSETLIVGGGLFTYNFIVGCSLSSNYMPEGGIVGFGRSWESLPSQLGLKSFSCCLVSYENPNPTASSGLVLTITSSISGRSKINYTPFLNNPNHSSLSAWRKNVLGNFYYVWIKNIFVGGVDVKVPDEYLVLDDKGNGGTIVDTGTTLTWMEKPVFDLVFNEFRKQVGEKLLDTVIEFENPMDIEQCYNVSRATARKFKKKLPQLTFRFVGGAEMVGPMAKYFMHDSVLCMCVEGSEGIYQSPAIILGNYQMQDHYMKFDLENNRLGIHPQKC